MTIKSMDHLPSPPWERMNGEGDIPFRYFQIYRNMGSHRSLSTLSDATGAARSTLKKHSARFLWAERCRHWDNNIVNAETDVVVEHARAEMSGHLQALSEMREGALELLRELLSDEKRRRSVRLAEIHKTLLDVIKLERGIDGQPSDHVSVQVTPEQLGKLSADQLASLVEIQRAMGDSDD